MLKAPTIHINGTSGKQLLDAHSDAYHALIAALNGWRAIQPNGRDYYPQGEDAYAEARKAWEAHYSALQAAFVAISNAYLEIHEQLETKS